MDLEQDMKELSRILEDKKLIESELRHHKAYICKEHCPVKIGQEVVCNGYSHEGKTIIVDRVFLYDNFRGKLQFRASGIIKKKDGTLGSQRGEWRDKAS